MGMRGAIASIAAVAVLSACSAADAAPAPSAQPAKVVSAADWTGTHNLTAAQAEKAVTSTPKSAMPAPKPYGSWDCDQPMVFHPEVAPGVDVATVYRELEYPVAYLNALGYQASVGAQQPYEVNAEQPAERGVITVVVAKNRADQPDLEEDHTMRAEALFSQSQHNASAALIVLESRGLAGDIILHEFGHVLGLDHKAGTVMAASGISPATFDADETASIVCN